MEIPWQQLEPETLQSLIEDFVTRDGTDYGEREVSLESKTKDVYQLLRAGKVKIVFDPETESVDLREVTSQRF